MSSYSRSRSPTNTDIATSVYYVVIPNGFVAHGNRTPRRLHGVLFGLPDTSTTDVVTFYDERFISVTASSNEFDVQIAKESLPIMF